MALNYLLDPMFQIENSAGKPATDGWLEVYIHGTRTKYYCASNFDGTLHPFKIKLDSLGSNIVLADDGQAYDVYAYNRFGSLLMSRYNVQPGSGGSGSIITGEMQHWLGMYGPTYTHFPGDEAGHTLGIPRQSVDYDGDFIDHIETAPYPDGDVPAYIYLKPGLYHIDCVIRYQQDSGDIKNTLDEVLIYTGHGNANEDVAYQLDASGPDTNGNRHCLKQSFIRKVTEEDGGLLYFAPGTPTDWTDAYIQTLSIVKLDSMIYGKAGIPKVTHDDTMTGDGTPDSPLSIQDALDGKQDTLTPGEGITIDSDGNISSETYSEGWGVDIDENNVISVDPDIIQQKLTPGEGINIDSDGNISANEYTEGWGIDIDENNVISVDPDIIQQKLTPGDGIQIDSDGTITAEGEKYYEGWGIDINENNEISVDPDIIQKKITTGEGLTLDSDGNLNLDLPPIIPLVAGDGVTLTDSNGELIISAEGRQYTAGEGITIDGEGNISVDPNTVQEKLTAGQNIEIDSDGVISADVPQQEQADWEQENTSDPSYIRNRPDLSVYQEKLTAGQNIEIDSDGTISAELPQEEEVEFEEFDPSDYQTKLTAGQNIEIDSDGVISADVPAQEQADWDEENSSDPSYIRNKPDLSVYQEKLTAGDNITIDSDGVISADVDECLWFLGTDGKVQPKDGKHFEAYGDPSYSQSGQYYFKKAAKVESNDSGFEIDGLLSSHTGSDTEFGPYGTVAKIYTEFAQDPYMGARRGGLVVKSFENSSVHPESRIDMYAGNDSGYGVENYKNKTYVQAIVGSDYVRMRSDDIIRHVGNTDGHAPFVLVHQTDTDKEYVLKPTATGGIYQLVENTGGAEYTGGEGVNIDSDGNINVDFSVVQKKLTAGDNITIDSNGVISAAGSPTYTAGNGINIDGNNEISVDTDVVQEKLTAGQNIEIDSDGTISAELPSEEEVTFEEIDPSTYATKTELQAVENEIPDVSGLATKTELTQGLAGKQDTLTAGQNIEIDSDGVISATSEPCLWFLDTDGKITPKDGKHFEVYGAPSYTQVGQYYFKKAAKVQSNDSGFEIDGLLASHTGSDTQYGDYGAVAKVYTEFAQDPYMGARRGGLIVKSFENSSVHPESHIDMYAGNDSGYGVENYKNKTYVQAVVGSDYVRMRSDDIVRHVGNSDSHAPFVSAQQTDTTKTYVMKPTSTTGVYDLVEESSGGGGGTTYTAGQGIDITNDVISVDSDSVAMKSDLPSEEEVEFEEFNPENMTVQQKNAMARAIGVDETELWSSSPGSTTGNLSEAITNFERIRVYWHYHENGSGVQSPCIMEIPIISSYTRYFFNVSFGGTNCYMLSIRVDFSNSFATFTVQSASGVYVSAWGGGGTVAAIPSGTIANCVKGIYKIVGIHRISNS